MGYNLVAIGLTPKKTLEGAQFFFKFFFRVESGGAFLDFCCSHQVLTMYGKL